MCPDVHCSRWFGCTPSHHLHVLHRPGAPAGTEDAGRDGIADGYHMMQRRTQMRMHPSGRAAPGALMGWIAPQAAGANMGALPGLLRPNSFGNCSSPLLLHCIVLQFFALMLLSSPCAALSQCTPCACGVSAGQPPDSARPRPAIDSKCDFKRDLTNGHISMQDNMP